MRELKFRAWDPELKKMAPIAGTIPMMLEAVNIMRADFDKFQPIAKRMIWLQYTGLKDKNSKEIFEGDIIKPLYEGKQLRDLLVVKYLSYGFTMTDVDGDDHMDGVWYHEVEVIGNIYENPELLK